MDKQISALAAMLLLGAISCTSSSDYNWEMTQVDSLYQVVDKYESQLDSLDQDSIKLVAEEVRTTYVYLDENYPDRDDRDFWLTDMNYLARTQKGLTRFEENQQELNQQIDFSKHQLSTLLKSLQDEQLKGEVALTDSAAEEYLRIEADAVQAITFKMRKIYPELKSALVIWDSLQPRLDSIEAHLRQQP